MSNPGEATVSLGDTGETVLCAQRALRRTPNLALAIDGVFGPRTQDAVVTFQTSNGLVADGIVGPVTWEALPEGCAMPQLAEGSTGDPVASLQTRLTSGAPGQWEVTPRCIDGVFGPATRASVVAFQQWAGITTDGIVGEYTWSAGLNATSSTLETCVGTRYVVHVVHSN